ncbi:hypothetical protein CLV24_10231 [Pontibacter ummariensis]|uniref:Lipocalin-like domain-containing protein n=1 Tax=Pontibacter ummariensis TaxID=1610492 RepID=A0A239C8L9_9BACT|nr:hypothetical protein [Pontibacter ummariensis]PRY15410.1 hypothetical protein CLV24_10231 [Pontibacter ummariensis]SNS16008.1 hypothetical protein SAMN06296052_102382 [Pontibacter ummariensis]
MHNFRLLYYCLALVCLVSFTGCGDDDEDDVSPNVSLLTGGEWAGNAVFYNGEDISELYEQETGMDITSLDALFERDGTFVETYDGTTVAEGTWEFLNDERVLVFDPNNSDSYETVIYKLDEDELFYQQNGVEFRFVR